MALSLWSRDRSTRKQKKTDVSHGHQGQNCIRGRRGHRRSCRHRRKRVDISHGRRAKRNGVSQGIFTSLDYILHYCIDMSYGNLSGYMGAMHKMYLDHVTPDLYHAGFCFFIFDWKIPMHNMHIMILYWVLDHFINICFNIDILPKTDKTKWHPGHHQHSLHHRQLRSGGPLQLIIVIFVCLWPSSSRMPRNAQVVDNIDREQFINSIFQQHTSALSILRQSLVSVFRCWLGQWWTPSPLMSTISRWPSTLRSSSSSTMITTITTLIKKNQQHCHWTGHWQQGQAQALLRTTLSSTSSTLPSRSRRQQQQKRQEQWTNWNITTTYSKNNKSTTTADIGRAKRQREKTSPEGASTTKMCHREVTNLVITCAKLWADF